MLSIVGLGSSIAFSSANTMPVADKLHAFNAAVVAVYDAVRSQNANAVIQALQSKELRITPFIDFLQNNASALQKYLDTTLAEMSFPPDLAAQGKEMVQEARAQLVYLPTGLKKLGLLKPYTSEFDATLDMVTTALQEKYKSDPKGLESAFKQLSQNTDFFSLVDLDEFKKTIDAFYGIIRTVTSAGELDLDSVTAAALGLKAAIAQIPKFPKLAKAIAQFIFALGVENKLPSAARDFLQEAIRNADELSNSLKLVKGVKDNGILIAYFVNEALKAITAAVTPPEKLPDFCANAARYDEQTEKAIVEKYTNKQSPKYSPYYALAEKYKPIFYIHSKEEYWPITAEEYLMGKHTSLKRKNGEIVIPKGAITAEKIWHTYQNEVKTKGDISENYDLFFDIDPCVIRGSNPALYSDTNKNLKVPLYVFAWEQNNKLYIQYIHFYAFNAPFDVAFLTGDTNAFDNIQDAHEADVEHVTLEFDKNTQALQRMYFSAHGTTEGVWMKAKGDGIEYENGHPVVYSALGSHAAYPFAGYYTRIFGAGSDRTDKGTRWDPTLRMLYTKDDPRFEANSDDIGYIYNAGVYGKRGVGSMARQSWSASVSGDKGRPLDQVKGSHCSQENQSCIIPRVPLAVIPD